MTGRRQNWLRYLVLALLLVAIALVAFTYWPEKEQSTISITSNSAPSAPKQTKKKASAQLINLQPTVNAWAAKQSGQASVVVYDFDNNKNVAKLNPDQQYFTASLYKLYVAYVGYLEIAKGKYSLGDPYLSGYTRGGCLDAMIRDSYSPCAEKMWVELGKENITRQMQGYGLTNTSLTSLYTSAQDAATILERLWQRRELSEKHTKLYLDSMLEQDALYRRGLPSGFVNSVVYNKVGWNGYLEWHDAAVVTLPNGRSYAVVVLTKSVGTKSIIDLAKAIEAKLLD